MSFGFVAATVGTIGLGMSAASAAGAFNGPVDKWTPTPQEMAAAKKAKEVFALGQDIQKPLDVGARQDIKYLGSPTGMNEGAGNGLASAWSANPDVSAPVQNAALTSGGPGSGRWWGALYDTKTNLNRGLYGAEVAGRLGALNSYTNDMSQYLGRKTGDLNSGLAAMTSGGAQAAQAQADRINAQVQRNVAMSSAMSGLGNTMIGAATGLAGGMKK